MLMASEIGFTLPMQKQISRFRTQSVAASGQTAKAPAPPPALIMTAHAPGVIPGAQVPSQFLTALPPAAAVMPVSTLPDSSIAKRSSTLAFAGLLGVFLLAGTAAAVIVARSD